MITTNPQSKIQNLKSKIFQSYVYSYPHKTAYRPISPQIPLTDVWSQEDKDALFLYIHIPFCEMRCGFCNLFTTVTHNEDFVTQYVNTLQKQAKNVKAALGKSSFARLAIGGGTPTQLPIHHLETVLNVAEDTMGANLQSIPISVEMSPETATKEKLELLRSRGVTRASIGVQSFFEKEVVAVNRRQTTAEVEAALTRMRAAGFPTINIDLIYGLPGQTVETWLQSIRSALRFEPEEIFLYPLYVRPLTGLGTSDKEWDDIRLNCYRQGRDFLLSQGYIQKSMRMFQKNVETLHVTSNEETLCITSLHHQEPVYCCQQDGMVGLGCGARSYTDGLHYSNEYAVVGKGIREILQGYIQTPEESFDFVNYGFQLNAEEKRRRYILLSLLSHEGLKLHQYQKQFHTELFSDFSELSELIDLELVIDNNRILRLTQTGVEYSDAIGEWLFSEKVRRLMQRYQLK
ncbi:MAG: STM4012 family radical SAM protein [Cyanobacteria bacterium J06643_5]